MLNLKTILGLKVASSAIPSSGRFHMYVILPANESPSSKSVHRAWLSPRSVTASCIFFSGTTRLLKSIKSTEICHSTQQQLSHTADATQCANHYVWAEARRTWSYLPVPLKSGPRRGPPCSTLEFTGGYAKGWGEEPRRNMKSRNRFSLFTEGWSILYLTEVKFSM
jgi:hypothetical protein